MRLGPAARSAGFRLNSYESVGSTNDVALAAASAGDAGNCWFVATAQSAGRGRNGRPWQSLPGNLFASLLLIDPCDPVDLPKLGFVAGTAAHAAVACLLPPGIQPHLKWPNDLLVEGAKLCGILLEGRSLADSRRAVVIGIGVNCTHVPEGLPYTATSVAACGGPADPASLFWHLAERMTAALARFDRGRGFAAIREEWLAGAHGLGQPVLVRQGETLREGVFGGIDETGRLLLDGQQGRAVIDAGDIAFPGSVTAA